MRYHTNTIYKVYISFINNNNVYTRKLTFYNLQKFYKMAKRAHLVVVYALNYTNALV